MKNRVIGIIIAIEFFAMCLVLLFSFNWKQGMISEAENRTLTMFPTLFDSEGELSENLLQDFDVWFQDNIGLRDPMINLSSIISFNILRQPTTEKVELGKDGWLFYDDDDNMNIVEGTYEDFGEDELASFCNRLIEIQKRLEKQGREFIFIIPPSKVSIYPEYIQSDDYSVMETPADTLANYLEENSTIKVVRLKDTLIDEKDNSNKLLYFKTDTHWNHYGRYIGYKKIIKDLNEWDIINTKPIEAEFFTDGPYVGDLSKMMGIIDFAGNKYSEDSFENIRLINSNVEDVSSGDFYTTYVNQNGLVDGSMWKNDKAQTEKKLLIYGDSMIGRCNVNYIAEHFSETTFVFGQLLEQSRIDYFDPDVVVLDISERSLNNKYPELFDIYLNTDFNYDSENNTLDIYYYDDGQYDEMYFPTWSEYNGQDDLVLYQAERTDSDSWHVQVDLKEHDKYGKYNIDFYYGPNGSGEYVMSSTYNIVDIN